MKENHTRTLCFSSLLPKLYPEDAQNIFKALEQNHVDYGLISGTKDVWVRDFMPVQTRNSRLCTFIYDPSYLKDRPDLRTDLRTDKLTFTPLCSRYPICESDEWVDIRLDGGNVVYDSTTDTCIVSDRVFSENPQISRYDLVRQLKRALQTDHVILIPSLKSDMTGHADGMVRFAGQDTVICNEPQSKNGFDQKLRIVLENHGLRVFDFPYEPAKGISAVGCYLNFLEISDRIFLPVFGISKDEQAVKAAKKIFENKKIVPVLIPEIAKAGGGLHCISWDTDSYVTGKELL